MFASFVNGLKKYSGTILIELMLAVALGLLLVSFLLGIYIASQRSYRLQAALTQIQDNAKTAITILKSDIRKAGYIGCPRLTHDFAVASYPPYSLTPQNKLVGGDSEIIVRHVEFPGVVLNELMRDDLTLYTSMDVRFSAGDTLVISDCKAAEIFQVKKIFFLQHLQKIIPTHPLHNRYEPYAEISRLEVNKYLIAKTKRKNQDGSPVYSLFIEDINLYRTELVQGINRMQIFYSVDRGGKLIDTAADEIADWSKVVGVAIDLDLIAFPIKKTWHMYVAL